MTDIRLYNTKTRTKEPFVPLDADNVRMYVCGPTVYDRAHLGNARPVIVFDVLYRLLRHVYGADHVTYVRNFTDVDDKINAEALRRQKAGSPGTLEELIHERTEETIAWYHADMDALGAMRPDAEPRAPDFSTHRLPVARECAVRILDDQPGTSRGIRSGGSRVLRAGVVFTDGQDLISTLNGPARYHSNLTEHFADTAKCKKIIGFWI